MENPVRVEDSPPMPAEVGHAAVVADDRRSSVDTLDDPQEEEEHPPSFYCPISHQVMHDPVVLCDGHTYERRHIERWLEHKQTSPVTGAPLAPPVAVFPNHAMRNAVEEYFNQVPPPARLPARTFRPAGPRAPPPTAHGSFSSTPLLRVQPRHQQKTSRFTLRPPPPPLPPPYLHPLQPRCSACTGRRSGGRRGGTLRGATGRTRPCCARWTP